MFISPAQSHCIIGLKMAGQEKPASIPADIATPFVKVDEMLYRGGQPLQDRGIRATHLPQLVHALKYLRDKFGIKTIVNLRSENVDIEKQAIDLLNAEAGERKEKRMSFLNIRLNATPNDASVQEVIDFIAHDTKSPVFVHCKKGENRSGFFVALYQIIKKQLPFKQIYEDMLANGHTPTGKNTRYSSMLGYLLRTRPEFRQYYSQNKADIETMMQRVKA